LSWVFFQVGGCKIISMFSKTKKQQKEEIENRKIEREIEPKQKTTRRSGGGAGGEFREPLVISNTTKERTSIKKRGSTETDGGTNRPKITTT